MKRLTLMGLVLALLLGTTLVAHALTAPNITVSKVDPPVPAVGNAGTSLELRNPAEELVLLDTSGQPWLRINRSGVTRKNEQGQWEELRKESFYYLNETEVGWFVTGKQTLPYPYLIHGTYGGRPFTIQGTYEPPGSDQKNDTGGLLAGLGVLLGLAVLAVAVIGGLIYGVVVLVRRKAQ